MSDSIVEIRDLSKHFPVRERGLLSSLFGSPKHLKAVDNVSLDIQAGEIVGLVGQSGCGKSTLGELLLRLQDPTDGEIVFDGEPIQDYSKKELASFRQRCQPIFQDPYESLNPRFTVARSVTEPLKNFNIGDREEREAKMMQALEEAGLGPPENYIDKFPKELSGGERQRVCIARAIVLDPDFIVADEPVSMLDVSIRASIMELFEQLQAERNLTMVYISHNLNTVNYLADRTAVMYLGNIVELGPTDAVIHDSAHPYTDALVDSIPQMDLSLQTEAAELDWDVPDPVDLPQGCRYKSQCPYATEKCENEEPDLVDLEQSADDSMQQERQVACYHPVTSGL